MAALQSRGPVSNRVMKHGDTHTFDITDEHRAGKVVVDLTGGINKYGVISPRFDCATQRSRRMASHPLGSIVLLPSHPLGSIVLIPSAGVRDPEEAR